MTQQGLFSLFLFLHVLGAIIAFGPALAFGVIGPYAAREREHTDFATRLDYFLMTRVAIPVGLTLPITGALMILTAQIDLSARQNWWLGLGIILYTIAILYAIFVQAPAVAKLIEMTSGGPRRGASGRPAAGCARAGRRLPVRRRRGRGGCRGAAPGGRCRDRDRPRCARGAAAAHRGRDPEGAAGRDPPVGADRVDRPADGGQAPVLGPTVAAFACLDSDGRFPSPSHLATRTRAQLTSRSPNRPRCPPRSPLATRRRENWGRDAAAVAYKSPAD